MSDEHDSAASQHANTSEDYLQSSESIGEAGEDTKELHRFEDQVHIQDREVASQTTITESSATESSEDSRSHQEHSHPTRSFLPAPAPPSAAQTEITPTQAPIPPSILTPRRSSSTATNTTHATSPIATTGIPPPSESGTYRTTPPSSGTAPASTASATPSTSTPTINMSGTRSSSSSAGASSSLATPAARGMPMLSGLPPVIESDACRACSKTFIPLFRKPHTCNHCGYQYCDSCCTSQALLPRSTGGGQRPSSGNPWDQIGETFGFQQRSGSSEGGYDMVEVCKYCMPMLNVTSGSPSYLRSLPLKRLQTYTKAYGLNTSNAIEKEDFVQAIVKARSGGTGCLAPDRESYYRRRSVPKEGVLPPPPPVRPAGTTNGTRPRATPNATSNARPFDSANGSHPQPQARTTGQGHHAGSGAGGRPPQSRPPPAAHSKPTPSAQKRAPSPPVPTINSLVALPTSYLSTSLSIGTLKAILFDNHVKVNYAEVLEKDELVKRVSELIKDERRRLERQAREEAAEEAASLGVTPPSNSASSADDREETRGYVPTGPRASLGDGLCVVCQENEAQLAVVDCGHLSMCQECSTLVMKTSRECPLCRTRIVTEQRLIRIFRT